MGWNGLCAIRRLWVMTALVDWVKVLKGYARMEAVPPLLETTPSRVIHKIYQEVEARGCTKRPAAPPAVASPPNVAYVARVFPSSVEAG